MQVESVQPSQETPLWTLLPKDLIEKVFSYLPLHSLFQARCVCKCWENVGFSNNLLKLRAEAPVSPPYFPVFLSKGEDRRWCAYDHVHVAVGTCCWCCLGVCFTWRISGGVCLSGQDEDF
jgi:hypothetical protein